METLICPTPLLTWSGTDYVNSYDTTVIYATPGQPCVIPCPSLAYDSYEWDLLQSVLFVGSLCALIASLVAFLSHLTEFYKYYIRVMFIGGFLVSSAIVFFFAVMNRKNEIVCADNNTAFIQQGPVCVFQACASVFVFTWIELWSCILAFDSYLMVHNRQVSLYASTPATHGEQKLKLYKLYTVVAVVVCTGLTIIPLIAGNYGFDPEANVPICLFLFSTDSTYFWTIFYLPFTLLVFGCIYFSVRGICQIQAIFVNSPRYFGGQSGNTSAAASSVGGSGHDIGRSSLRSSTYSNPVHVGVGDFGSPDSGDGDGNGRSESDDSSFANSKLLGTRDSLSGFSDYDFSEEEECELEDEMNKNSHLTGSKGSGGTADNEKSLLRNSHMSSNSGGGIRLEQFPNNKNKFNQNQREEQEQEQTLTVENVFMLSPSTTANTSAQNSSQRPSIIADLNANNASDGFGSVNGNGNGNSETSFAWNPASSRRYNNDESFIVGIGDETDSGSDRNYRQCNELTSVIRGDGNGNVNTKNRSGGGGVDPDHDMDRQSTATYGEEEKWGQYDVANPVMPGVDRDNYRYNNYGGGNNGPPSTKMRSDSRGRTESGTSNFSDGIETISLGTDNGSDENMDARQDSQGSVLAWGGTGGRSSSANSKKKKSIKRSFIKSTRDRILGLLTENEMLAQTLKYNGRAIIFVIIFCLTTLYIIPLLAELQYFEYDKYQNGAADFVTCLLTASGQSQVDLVPQNVDDVSAYVNSICGDVPSVRPKLGLIISAICWYAAYGIIPALVFGAGSYMVDCCIYCSNDSLSVNPDELSFNSRGNGLGNRQRSSTATSNITK